jgi:MFS transporter, ACS family, hexuronate transporter
MPHDLPTRTPSWKWTVCGMLMFATMLNYMDRLTLNQTAKRVMAEFTLDEEQYGLLETTFSIAFGFGAVGAGLLVDRWNVWWLYPTAVFAWSVAGFATGLVETLLGLFCCRFALGLMESGHWPCALRTTQRLLPPAQRTLGNGILQSGAALGAIFTPLIVIPFLQYVRSDGTPDPRAWRWPFLVIGSLGLFWVAAWLMLVRRRDLALAPEPAEPAQAAADSASLRSILRDRRFWVLAVVVASINGAWHFFRVWLPLFLQNVHAYDEVDAQYFMSFYYVATDAGTLTAGFTTVWLSHHGFSVHRSRLMVFCGCALLTTLSFVVSQLAAGPALLTVFLIIGFGALGLFPPYYSFTQELTVRHQGKVTGMLGCVSWLSVALMQWLIGKTIKETGSYAAGLAFAGVMPLVGFAALALFWEKRDTAAKSETDPKLENPA